MKISVLMITHNRPSYTRLALERLCKTLPDYASLTIWDNASGPEMRELLCGYEKNAKVAQVIFNKTNDKLRGPTNWFWQHAGDADYVSKVDDDCLMPDNWCETLLKLHAEVPETGVLGCWRFLDEDFELTLASRKIQRFGDHQLMRNCWVEGSGYLMKRAMLERAGVMKDSESFTSYCTRAASLGFINGWYYPFLYQEHMDDPRVPHSEMRTEADFQRLCPLSARTFGVKTREDWIRRLKYSAWTLQACSFDPKHFLGWRASVRRKLSNLTGLKLLPRA